MKIFALYCGVYPTIFACIAFALYFGFVESLSLFDLFWRIMICIAIALFAFSIGERLLEDIMAGNY